MSGNTKKELILCDYCLIAKDSTQIYTARKQFAGCKIIDILQKITQCTIPAATPIKLCSLCASTLHSTTGTIDKAIEVVCKLLPTGRKNVSASKTVSGAAVEEDFSKHGANVDLPPLTRERKPSTNGTPTAKSKKIPIDTPDKFPFKPTIKEKKDTSIGVQPSPKKQPVEAKELLTNTTVAAAPSSPKKQHSIKDSPDDRLLNAIKVTAAKNMSLNKKSFINLFGASANNVTDTEDEEMDDDDVVETVIECTDSKNIAIGFECKLCDFTSTHPISLKNHLKGLHGQKRPRIFNCLKCTKSFGVIKSLKAHLLTHSISEQKEENPVTELPLAVITTLKPKPNQVEDKAKSEYTFAINGNNSSTPKQAAGEPEVLTSTPAYICEVCQKEMKGVRALKHHLKTVHDIERPKAFKCDVCDTYFMHKVTMTRHLRKKHGEQDGSGAAPAKINARRKTIACDLSTTQESKKTKATAQTNAPAKIKARRKTVAAELNGANQPSMKVTSISPLKNAKLVAEAEEVSEVPIELKSELLAAVDQVTDPHKKLKKPIDVLITSFGQKLDEKDNNKSEVNGKEVTGTPTNSKSKAVEGLSSTNSSKKSKSKKKTDTDTIDSSKILNTGTPSKIDETQTEDSSQISATINGTPKKWRKRNAEKELEQDTSQVKTAEEGEVADETFNLAQLRPVRKSKSDKRKEPHNSDIELLDEINPNVKPHKRIKLDSMALSESDLSCSMCNKVVGSRKRLDSHMHKKHDTQLKCPICQVLYTDNMEYVRHFAKCDSDDGLPCGIKKCTKVFTTANFLSNHLNKKHKDTK